MGGDTNPHPVISHRRISRTKSKNASSTLISDSASASTNPHPKDLAKTAASCVVTSLADSREHLLPTRTMGKKSLSFTRRICCWKVVISSKLWRLVMLYTSRKPSAVLIYCSLIAEYSSWPAVSSTSSRATSSSMTHCLRYESSIVGSYSSTKSNSISFRDCQFGRGLRLRITWVRCLP